MAKRWQLQEPISADFSVMFPEIHPVLLQLLWNRGLKTQTNIDEYLNPEWSTHVRNPYLFRDMKKAVERVYEAIGRKELIAVFGDYDADGVSAAVILVSALKRLGAVTEVYLPHREREGYGLNNEAVNYLSDKGAKLIITCDCGIANVAQVDHANTLGLDVIVTDHHQAQEVLPKAYAILHCGLEGETYPFKYLSGGGMAFKFVQGLLRYEGCPLALLEREAFEKWLLDVVAISIVADMVPLTGENRTLVKFGLTVLKKTRRLGLKKLIEVAGLSADKLNTYSIGFQIAPRINAAGRLDHANAAYALLMSEIEVEASELARSFNVTNTERQRITDEMFQLSSEQIGVLKEDQFLVSAFEPSWSVGMVGLVAGKLVQQYNRPALVMCQMGDEVVGSGRSVSAFDLTAALTQCKDYLLGFGGHKQAAGFRLPKAKLDDFLNTFAGAAKNTLAGMDLSPSIMADAEIGLAQTDWSLVDVVNKLEPTGQQNPSAKFISRSLTILQTTLVGSAGQHLKLQLTDGTTTRKFIVFRQGDLYNQLKTGDKVDVLYEVGVNEWNGNREIELKVVDIRKT